MSIYVAIYEDGVIAINCREVVDDYQQIEFYDIDTVLYHVNLKNGRININDRLNNREESEMMVFGKHSKFEKGAIDIIPNRKELQQSILYWIFLW